LSRYPILSPANHVALPHTSTSQPIQHLTHILEDAHSQQKEFWILAQDMSKAYNSVYLPLLKKALQRIKCPMHITNLIIRIFNSHTNKVITNFGMTNP